ncbi:MAG: carboxymuconolactone decarboxylase family protein [Anaerolineales bacterium]|nr:carboxymuconolactone decarboxylase family protein [Anaerolineales bacterium]
MNTFKRRIYHSVGEFLKDLRIILSRRKEIRPLMRGKVIAPAFRERLMLVVTAVNRCRYCSYAHARGALSKGIPQEEINALGNCMFAGSPAEEVQALFYAQHWAEANGEPDPAAREQAAAQYGEPIVRDMELALRMIRAGNLLGNTFDNILHIVTFGKWGAEQ